MSSVVISGDTSGAITLAAPAVSGTNTATLPAATGTVMVSGNMPAFSYYQSSAQTISNATFTKITFTSSDFDTTSGMYASSRFTPTIAGYYQVNGAITLAGAAGVTSLFIYKNGAAFKNGAQIVNSSSYITSIVSALVYCNGSTDYIELYGQQATGANATLYAGGTPYNYFQAVMVRAA